MRSRPIWIKGWGFAKDLLFWVKPIFMFLWLLLFILGMFGVVRSVVDGEDYIPPEKCMTIEVYGELTDFCVPADP